VRIPLLVLPIGYADYGLTLGDEVWNAKIFSQPTPDEEAARFDLFGPCGSSVNTYYREVTCGRFLFEPVAELCGTPDDGVIRVDLDVPHPLTDVRAMAQAVGQAVAYAAQYIDFQRYDRNHDHALSQMELAIVVVSAGGYGDKTGSMNRCYYYGLDLSGLRRRGYVVVTERRDDLRPVYAALAKAAGTESKYTDFPVSLGTLVHELGHAFGTPDLYNIGHLTALSGGQKNGSIAVFPGTALEYTRSSPCHYGAYTMVKAGFVEPILLEHQGTYTACSAGTGRYNVYKIPTRNRQEYFLIENRQFEGFDRTLGSNANNRPLARGGIAIWHINEAFGNNNDMEKKLVDIEEASEATLGYSHIQKDRNHNPRDPFYPLPGNAEFSSRSTPSNRSYGGEPQPWKLDGFSAPGREMTFVFTPL